MGSSASARKLASVAALFAAISLLGFGLSSGCGNTDFSSRSFNANKGGAAGTSSNGAGGQGGVGNNPGGSNGNGGTGVTIVTSGGADSGAEGGGRCQQVSCTQTGGQYCGQIGDGCAGIIDC